MGGSKKWSVTYTRHVKQKRKVYQDGFLELDASSQKVILYDDCETILHVRFVKKDDIIKSGETLAFDSYLVDIGDLHGDQKPLPQFNTKVTVVSKSFQSPKFGIDAASVNRKPNLGMGKARVRNLSPSQKIIREFQKSEMNKYGSSPGCSDAKKSSKMEWQVLYTAQITQKAKKYHDGILQLLTCGSQKQSLAMLRVPFATLSTSSILDSKGEISPFLKILLYDANRRLLDSRFLKKDEVITSGESITFDGHLVDVGECEGDNKPLMDLNLEDRNSNLGQKTNGRCESIHSQDKFPIEWEAMYTTHVTQKSKKYSNGILKLAMSGSYQMQVILLTEDGTMLSRRYLQSSESIRTGSTLHLQNYLVELGDLRTSCKEHLKEASPLEHLNSKNQSSIDKYNMSGLLVKSPVRAAQEILSILKKPMTQKDVTEMEIKSADGFHASQSPHVRTFDTRNQIEQQPLQDSCHEGRTVVDLNEENNTIHVQRRSGCISRNMVDIGCPDRNAMPPDPPTAEPKLLVAMELDLKAQQTIAPVLQDPSTDILEKGYCIEPVPCKEDQIGGLSIASGITLPFVEEVTSENVTQPCAGIEEIDVGWDNRYHVIGVQKSNGCTSRDFCDDELKIAEQDISTKEADDLPSFDLGF